MLVSFKDWWKEVSGLDRRIVVAVICGVFLALHLFILRLDFVALVLLAVIFLILFPDIFAEIPTPVGMFKLKEHLEETVAQAGEDDARISRRNKLAGLLMLLADGADKVVRAQGFKKITAQAIYDEVQKKVLRDVNQILEEIAKEERGK